MRIHLVTDAFTLGGGIEHIFQVVHGLPDIQFAIFGHPGPATTKFKDLTNVEIHDQGFSPAQVLASHPDLVHIHHLKPLLSFFKNPFKTYPVPVIYTAHGLHIHKYEFFPDFSARMKYALRFQLEKTIFSRATQLIAVSQEDARFMEQKYHLPNIHYITNGIDFNRVVAGIGESKVSLRQRLGLPVSSFLFVTVARFDFQKGYDILIRTIASMKDTLASLESRPHFILVGDGSLMEEMKQWSEELSVSPFITFLGVRADVYDILRASDIFLLPSRWEGLPIVLLEAGLLKIPVLASATYGNREIVGENNGILFPNGDMAALEQSIKNVLANRFNLSQLAENMFQQVQAQYSLEKMLSKLRSLYSSFQ